jgi:mannose-6-phosphate isomerase
MTQPPLYPLLLTPVLHTRVWGGRKLAQTLAKDLPSDEPYGESWELHDSTTVANGALAGHSLATLLDMYGAELVGAGIDTAHGFPLLIKFLNAEAWLSVQVHPNDQQAHALEGDPRGKTEAWIILDAVPQAKLVIGIQEGSTRNSVTHAIQSNTLESLLVYATVETGDVLFMPANTVHALGGGLLVYEVQQSSDVTYRLYDWGRMGLDGNPRPLHIEKGVQVANLAAHPVITHPTGDKTVMVECPYFRTILHEISDDTLTLPTDGAFHALTCIEGSVTITHDETTIVLNLGQTALIPSSLGAVVIVGHGRVLRSLL